VFLSVSEVFLSFGGKVGQNDEKKHVVNGKRNTAHIAARLNVN
jgi:hypothetical protein